MHRHDALVETLKTAPPVSVGGLTLFGVSLPDIVQIVTLIWLLILIVGKLPDLFNTLRKFRTWVRSKYDRKH